MVLEEFLTRRSRELGFDECRITTADAPASGKNLQSWLANGSHGEMGWIERNTEKRLDPQKVLPGARSIVALAVSYFAPEAEARDESLGQIARYARHTDYHDVIAEKLKLLTEEFDEMAGGNRRSLWYIDTGPILERDLAARSGLGFVGKHTNLISRRLGNWFFICEILTTVRLNPNRNLEPNRCGTCSRCIDACPTNAIRGPFELDARRCISYLTIELKGSIPEHLRSAIGDRIYGCDDCLAICPWNRFAKSSSMMKTARRSDFDQPDLLKLLTLDAEGFNRLFKGTPLKRTKRRGVLRNVCVALGNTGDEGAIPHLERMLIDPEPLIVEHATWAIKRIRERARREA